ncbi:MAG: response regulator transcription factor [Candidatus Saccharibacteria bacterium]|nr:response regulator transcription factor [Pseudorhodobacter sp.]
MKAKILAVDDEPEILALVEAALENEGFDVFTALSVSDFRNLNAEHTFDIYLIDVGLPDGSGFSLVKELRKGSDAGILLLTGRSSETDQVVGLEIGADDYVTKPFRLRELAARVNAVYRRSAVQTDASPAQPDRVEPPEFSGIDFTFDGYKLSMSGRRLWGPDGAEIVLTTAEFDLLAALLKRRGQVLDRDQLMNAMKGRDWESYDRAIDGLVSRLRRKIPAINRATHYVRTVHGVGYSFNG